MTKQFVPFPKIGQFRQVVKNVRENSAYLGQCNNNLPIMDHSLPKPVITFYGSVKLHGTNAGVCFNPETNELYAQSRSRVIDVDKDNAGFAFWVEANKEELTKVCSEYADGLGSLITVFGEWCGGNIQKGVALTGLPKMFVVFKVKVGEVWLMDSEIKNVTHDYNMYTVHNFPTYSIDIDFNNPDLSVPELQRITLAVEDKCPVGEVFGVNGVGEGVVWTSLSGDMFKVKGEKHSSSKVKKLASVDVEKMENVDSFVNYTVTESRLEQGIDVVFTQKGLDIDIKMLGDFLKWLMRDIVSEEVDTLSGNGLEPKDVGKAVSQKARTWFMDKYI